MMIRLYVDTQAGRITAHLVFRSASFCMMMYEGTMPPPKIMVKDISIMIVSAKSISLLDKIYAPTIVTISPITVADVTYISVLPKPLTRSLLLKTSLYPVKLIP